MAPHFKRVVIYGVGLLGGSLGMAMRRRAMADQIVGLGRSRKRLDRARQLGAIDSATTDAGEALGGADALVMALPPRLIRKKWADLAPLLEPGAFVTDVGSVKQQIVAEAEKRLPPETLFIGSHPMAGSERSGVEAARGDLFEGASCFITPTETTSPRALGLAAQFWRDVGSKVAIMEPRRHDEFVASMSHLPHLMAVALVQALYARGDSTALFQSLVGNGFRDSTRIASGEPHVWEQIFTENSTALVQNLDKMIEILTEWRGRLSGGDGSRQIIEVLAEASRRRNEITPGSESGAS